MIAADGFECMSRLYASRPYEGRQANGFQGGSLDGRDFLGQSDSPPVCRRIQSKDFHSISCAWFHAPKYLRSLSVNFVRIDSPYKCHVSSPLIE
jgi:hypothetical protein